MHTYTFFSFIHEPAACVFQLRPHRRRAASRALASRLGDRSRVNRSFRNFTARGLQLDYSEGKGGRRRGRGERRKEREASPREGPEQEALRARGPTSAAARLAVARRVGAARREREGLVSAFQRKQ